MGNYKEAMRWLAQARVDYKLARENFKIKAHELTCFLAHQSAEKALEAIII